MKVLIVGGAGQGKREYAVRQYSLSDVNIFTGGETALEHADAFFALDRLHLLFLELMERGEDPQDWVREHILAREDWVVLCDEVGCGVVPVDAFLRRWREEVGRACCALAEQADTVVRVTCGIALCLKGRARL